MLNRRSGALLVIASILASLFCLVVAPAQPAAAEDWSLSWPADGSITSVPGDCRPTPQDSFCGRPHKGYDLSVSGPSASGPIYSAGRGTVKDVVDPAVAGYGIYVEIQHTNSPIWTRYAHLSQQHVVEEERGVTKATRIGEEGGTGGDYAPHLHFEIFANADQESWMRLEPNGPGGFDDCSVSRPCDPRESSSVLRDRMVRRGDPLPVATRAVPSAGSPNVVGAAHDFNAVRGNITGLATAPVGVGYWLVKADGSVFAYDDGQGKVNYHGGANGSHLNKPIVGIAARPVSGSASTTGGYWLAAADGGVFAYGDAPFLGSAGGANLNRPVVGIAAHGRSDLPLGYTLAAADGGVFNYGNMPYRGGAGHAGLNYPYDMVVGIAAHPSNEGYWLATRRGRVFACGELNPTDGQCRPTSQVNHYGDASSQGLDDDHDIVGITVDPSGFGYWLVGRDGGIFSFGHATFWGNARAERHLPGPIGGNGSEPIVAMAATSAGGYRLAEANEGSVIAFGPMQSNGSQNGGHIAAGTGSGGTVPSPNHPPIGHTNEGTVAKVRGWAFDPNEPTRSIEVHVYIDGVGYNLGPTGVPRPDVNAAYNITGDHGFEWSPPVQWSDGNPHTIEVYAIDSTGGSNPRLSITTSSGVNAPPDGRMDAASAWRVTGWAFDPDDRSAPIPIRVTIDTTAYDLGSTWIYRPEINAGLGLTGNHGFDWAIPAQWRDGRRHSVAVDALDPRGGPAARISNSVFRVLTEDWTGGNGSLWNIGKWITTANSSSKRVDIQNNQGRLYVNGSSARATATIAPALNSEVKFTYKFDSSAPRSYLRIMLRGSGATGDDQMQTGYRVEIRNDSNSIKLQRYVGGVSTEIGSVSYTSGTNLNKLALSVNGNLIGLKAWPASGTEGPFQLVVNDTAITGSGGFQINHNWSSSSTGPRSVFIDDLTLTDLNP